MSFSDCFWSGFVLGIPAGLVAAGTLQMIVKNWRTLLKLLLLFAGAALLIVLAQTTADQCTDAQCLPTTPMPVSNRHTLP